MMLFVACALSSCGDCKINSPDYALEFRCTITGMQSWVPSWGGLTTTSGPNCIDIVQVWLPRNVELRPETELIELYLEGAAVAASVPGVLSRDVTIDQLGGVSCNVDIVEYQFSELPDGVYTVVHRRSSLPEGLELSIPWGTFDGEDALVTTIFHGRGPFTFDGGMPDAGR